MILKRVHSNLRKRLGFSSRSSLMRPMPHEFAIGEVFMPPLLVASLLGLLAAVVTANLLNRYRLSRFFFYPPLVFLALMIIYTVLIGTFIIKV
ncbi:MAG: DUF1656 domain-containing protein [Desulfobacterales bacterium]